MTETTTKAKRGRPKKAETAEMADKGQDTAKSAPTNIVERAEAKAIEGTLGIINEKENNENELRRQWREERQLVKGVFHCFEPAGGSVTFPFRKYKWDPIKTYHFEDGGEYEIPLGVARHLNSRCSYPIHQHVLGPDGQPAVDRRGKKVRRMSFESLEFK